MALSSIYVPDNSFHFLSFGESASVGKFFVLFEEIFDFDVDLARKVWRSLVLWRWHRNNALC